MRTAIARDMTFRGAFYVELFHVLMWIGLFFILIEVLFAHTREIAGWSKGNLIVLLGVWSLLDDLTSGTFWEGVKRIPSLVAEGQLDFIFTRPIDSQFLISVERFRISRAIPLIVDIALIVYGLKLGTVASWWVILFIFPIILLTGYLTSYAVFYFLHTLGFWFLRVDNVWAIYEGIENIGKYPLDVFGRHIKLLSLTIVPITIMMVFPAEALIGFLSAGEVVNALVVSIVAFYLARKFYQHSLRRYSSIA